MSDTELDAGDLRIARKQFQSIDLVDEAGFEAPMFVAQRPPNSRARFTLFLADPGDCGDDSDGTIPAWA